MNRVVSSKHLEAVSDLTLIAPIRTGFIPAFESVTYETRLQLLLKALFKIRSTAREHSVIKPFVDTAERIQSLLDFRLAVVGDGPKHLLLSATFDRPFEPYMRLIWDPLGPLLDVIFCNCEGYVTATGHSFEEYLAWVRKSQVDSDFFYSMSGNSVSDVRYLLQIEKLQRERNAPTGTAIHIPDAEAEAEKVRIGKHTAVESLFLGMEVLVALYRLTDFYPPDHPEGDGALLRKAAQQLLRGLGEGLPADAKKKWEKWTTKLIGEQYGWLAVDRDTIFKFKPPREQRAQLAEELHERVRDERLTYDLASIQGGIVYDYDYDIKKRARLKRRIRHGALLFMRIKDAQAARAFIGRLKVSNGNHTNPWPTLEIFLNLAFTWRGLVGVGLPQSELARFPQEFREGMEERAGLLGDLRASHPRRWRPPVRNWPKRPSLPDAPRIDLSEVDFVVQLRTTIAVPGSTIVDIHDEGHPLRAAVDELAADAATSGVELLAVETMRRAFRDDLESGRDHFGFKDGISQPVPVDHKPSSRDEVSLGEILWGYVNDRSDPPPPPSVFLDNGTFLVARKLRQYRDDLAELVEVESQRQRHWSDGAKFKIPTEEIYGELVGRTRDGLAMVGKTSGNDFDYEGDEKGEQCPFQAHIRRTNPRAKPEGETKRPTPRILRRGLSYGPPSWAADVDGKPAAVESADTGGEAAQAERGALFMAYGASIAEQFEVIQRWLNGGNSTGIGSWLRDPLMGVQPRDDKYTFRFRYVAEDSWDGQPKQRATTIRIELCKPFVSLEWGVYLFVPSMAAIKAIARLSPVQAEQERARRDGAEIERGQRIIARLQALAATGPAGLAAAALEWKNCLEDFRSRDPGERADGPAVWAAIRACHGGAIRVPYGTAAPGVPPDEVVLVASKDLVMRVFRNRDDDYSMCGQMARMKQSFGPIFLGLDGGKEYWEKSQINGPIHDIPAESAFAVAYGFGLGFLKLILQLFKEMGLPADPPNNVGVWGELDLRRDFISPLLGLICNYWFGIPDTLGLLPAPVVDKCDPPNVDLGGWSWESVRKPRCPGDYLATSRYCFYPDPVPRVQAYGKAHGQALRKAVRAHLEATTSPKAKIAAIMAPLPAYKDKDEFARTLIGIMTGFLPPTDATLRWTLYDWLEDKAFWRLQRDYLGADGTGAVTLDEALCADAAVPRAVAQAAFARAEAALCEPLKSAMQKRPSPDMLWRTAVRRHRLGGVRVEDGDRVFIGIVSAMAEDADAGVADVYPVFGGERIVPKSSPGKGGTKGPAQTPPPQDPGPLHACPAYKFAMGTMLGILAALMDKLRVEALPAPLLVRVSALEARASEPLERGNPAPSGSGGPPPAREESAEPAPPPPRASGNGPES